MKEFYKESTEFVLLQVSAFRFLLSVLGVSVVKFGSLKTGSPSTAADGAASYRH